MKLLNLCCGAVRPQGEEWINVDNLHATLLPGTPERENLHRESNYRNRDVIQEGLTPEMEHCDGILMSHCVEHWTCQEAVKLMRHCWHWLNPGGVLLVSVPDASYFRKVHDEDTVENAERLFGEPIHLPDGETTFLGYGLFNRWHKAVLTEDALWCYFVRAGFERVHKVRMEIRHKVDVLGALEPQMDYSTLPGIQTIQIGRTIGAMTPHLNRLPFSLVMCGVKE